MKRAALCGILASLTLGCAPGEEDGAPALVDSVGGSIGDSASGDIGRRALGIDSEDAAADGHEGPAVSPWPGLLARLPVAITPLTRQVASAGDLVFTTTGVGPIAPFGGPDPEGAGVRPNIGFRTAIGAVVRAPLDAVVQNKLWQSGYGDWELHLVPQASVEGKWLVIIDHLQDVTVEVGDAVKVHQALGLAAKWQPTHSLVELHILREPKTKGDMAIHLCPLDVMTAESAATVAADVAAVFAAMASPPWKFPEADRQMVLPGCVCHIVPETPGRTKPALACAPK